MKTLKEVALKSDTAYWAMLLLATRKRHRSEPMRISRFKKSIVAEKLNIVMKDLYIMFQDLESLGYGTITYSRKKPFIFTWSSGVDFISLAKTAFDDLDVTKDYKELKAAFDGKKLVDRPKQMALLRRAKANKGIKPQQNNTMTMTLPNGTKVTFMFDEKADSSTIAQILKSLS